MIRLAIIIITSVLALNTELDLGVCVNDNGDGKIYNADLYYNYINYSCIGAKEGDKVLTVLFLNPTNLYCDDYIYRKDFVVR